LSMFFDIFFISLLLFALGYACHGFFGKRALQVFSAFVFLIFIIISFLNHHGSTSSDDQLQFVVFVTTIYIVPILLGFAVIHYSRNTPWGLKTIFAIAASGFYMAAWPLGMLMLLCGLGLECI
jgi:uncharacterized membrane protein YcaP (DUF421 family)